jgi:hypothetical protein
MPTRQVQPSEHSLLINGIEKRLTSTFKPIKPDGDFVRRLKERLTSTPSLRIEKDHASGLLLGILGVLAMMLGLLLGKFLWNYLFPPEQPD